MKIIVKCKKKDTHFVREEYIDDFFSIGTAPSGVSLAGHPVIEYLTPMNHRLEKSGHANWFVGFELLDFVKPYLTEDVLAADPYLSDISAAWNDAIQAGYYLQSSFVTKSETQKSDSQHRANYELLINKAATQLQ